MGGKEGKKESSQLRETFSGVEIKRWCEIQVHKQGGGGGGGVIKGVILASVNAVSVITVTM